jgi:hypothetical protein
MGNVVRSHRPFVCRPPRKEKIRSDGKRSTKRYNQPRIFPGCLMRSLPNSYRTAPTASDGQDSAASLPASIWQVIGMNKVRTLEGTQRRAHDERRERHVSAETPNVKFRIENRPARLRVTEFLSRRARGMMCASRARRRARFTRARANKPEGVSPPPSPAASREYAAPSTALRSPPSARSSSNPQPSASSGTR